MRHLLRLATPPRMTALSGLMTRRRDLTGSRLPGAVIHAALTGNA